MPPGLFWGGKARPRNVIRILDIDRPVCGRLPEEGFHVQWSRLAKPSEVDLGEGAGLGLKLVKRVPLAALPHLLEHLRRRAPTPRRAKLLVTGREHGGGRRQRGGSAGGAGGSGGVGGGGGFGGGDEGAVEVREDEAAGGARVGRDDLADAVGGGLPLHAGEEGDGVGELRLRGAVLRGAREAAEPRRHRGFPGTARRRRRRRRHRRARVLGAGDGKRRCGGAFGGFEEGTELCGLGVVDLPAGGDGGMCVGVGIASPGGRCERCGVWTRVV